MIYRDFQDLKLSALGLGSMRLPCINNDDAHPDEDETAKMVDVAFEQEINYYDTAYGYHAGKSEVVLGKALSTHPRADFYLADKFPGYDIRNMDKVESIFEEQLRRCQVEYFDFYLFHNVYEKNIDYYLDEKYGILDYLLKQKANGRIKHLGFSCHGTFDVLKRFVEAYGQYMEFCQIQLNYLDWDFQDAKAKVEYLNKQGLPIWVMEPLRGGKLAALLEKETAKLIQLRPEENTPAWAFRFLQSVPGVTMILSGMSSMDQLKDNIQTFKSDKPLNETERKTILEIARGMLKDGIVPCTACRYCTSHCPKGLDIPRLLSLYNEHKFTGGGFLAPMAIGALPADKRPSACIGCRSCEAVCPQQIKISEVLSKLNQMVGQGF